VRRLVAAFALALTECRLLRRQSGIDVDSSGQMARPLWYAASPGLAGLCCKSRRSSANGAK